MDQIDRSEGRPFRLVVVGVGSHASERVRSEARARADREIEAEPSVSVRFVCIDSEPPPAQDVSSVEYVHLDPHVGRRSVPGCGGRSPGAATLTARTAEALGEGFRDADLVLLVTAGGGVFGSAIAPAIVHQARACDAVCWCIATRPFEFEPIAVRKRAAAALRTLRDSVGLFLPVTSALASSCPDTPSLVDAVVELDRSSSIVLASLVRAISERTSVGLEPRDIETLLTDRGTCIGLHGVAGGARRASDAAAMAFGAPGMRALDFGNETVALALIARSAADVRCGEIDVTRRAMHAAVGGELECALWLGKSTADPETLELSLILAGVEPVDAWFEVEGRTVPPLWFDPVREVEVDGEILARALAMTDD